MDSKDGKAVSDESLSGCPPACKGPSRVVSRRQVESEKMAGDRGV